MTDRPASPLLRAVRISAKCPICEKPGTVQYRPFCSKRCADVDLGRWLKEGYRVATDEAPEGNEDQAALLRPTGQAG